MAIATNIGRLRRPPPAKTEPWGWAEVFAISQTALPAMLYLPGTQFLRPLIRISAFAISLLILLQTLPKGRVKALSEHPAFPALKACLLYLSLMVIHPYTSSLLAGVATVGFYAAVCAPIVWTPRVVQSANQLRRLLWILCICNGMNALVGILQVQNPARWMPAEFTSLYKGSDVFMSVVTYKGVDGRDIIRPPGLFDTPGAVAGPGMLAGFFGLVLLLETKNLFYKLVAMLMAGFGITVIYFTLVRSALLVLIGMLAAYAILRTRRGGLGPVLVFACVAIGIAAFGFNFARELGGESIEKRFSTLVEEKSSDLYYRSRGISVEAGFTEILPKYPLGAGLGRWGMVAVYVGGQSRDENGLWAETQMPAWIIDGGIVLLCGYIWALYKSARWLYVESMKSNQPDVANLGVVVIAASAGILVHCMSFPVFSTQLGLQYWFLVGAAFSVLRHGNGGESSEVEEPPPRRVGPFSRMPAGVPRRIS